MLIEDLIGLDVGVGIHEIQTIKRECSQFLNEAAGFPLLKSLPESYFNFHKVKVRLQKKRDSVTEVFERAFGQEFVNLRQRAVFAYSSVVDVPSAHDLFYVFPINGYKFLYGKEVANSGRDYQTIIDNLVEQLDSPVEATNIVSELLRYTYCSDNLVEAINSGSEIILYGIPYYYAIRATTVADYRSSFVPK